jgi:hypothetical protein
MMNQSLPQDPLTFNEDQTFTAQAEALIRESETLRLQYMRRSQSLSTVSLVLSLLAVLAGGAGFGWFLLMQGQLVKAVACIMIALFVPLLVSRLSDGPIKAYRRAHKREFMPKIARLMGALEFHPRRGISADILSKTGIVPDHDRYEAEDCFTGRHKGVRIILSEARLKKRGAPGPVFHGLLALMEAPQRVFEGHTIITADHITADRNAGTRWKNLQRLSIKSENPAWARFAVFSDRPDDASLFVGEKLFKELAEIMDVFNAAPLTAVLFRGKYIFLMIPTKLDMFEASDVFAPIISANQVLKTKHDIARLVEIIDVLEMYSI